MPHPIRVALIGYGYVGKTFHAPLIQATPGLELVAVASSDAAKVHADWPDVRVDGDPVALATSGSVDLVVIASPNDSHAPLALAALRAGRHVVVDKPFTLDLTQARAVIAAAKEADRIVSVYHNRRWDSDFLTVRQAIEDGLVGEVAHLESHIDRFRPVVRDRWRERDGPGGGLWYDLGPHLADQALCLFGPPERVHANLGTLRRGAQVDDWAHVVLDYPTRRVVLHAGMLVAGGTHRFVVHGSGGTLVKPSIDRQEAQLIEGMTPGAPGWGEDPDPLLVYDGSGGAPRVVPAIAGDQRRFYAGMAAALTAGAPNPVPAGEALAVMAVVEAAAEAARTGCAVVPDFEGAF